MTTMKKKLLFDAVITALLIFEMFFELTGDVLHEVVGVVFFVSIITHLVLSRKWISASSRAVAQGKKMKPAQIARIVMGILLAIAMLFLMASSLAISNIVSSWGFDLSGGIYSTWVLIHTASSYGLCILVTMHLAMHWATIVSAWRSGRAYRRRAFANGAVTAMAAVGAVSIGLNGASVLAASMSKTQQVQAQTTAQVQQSSAETPVESQPDQVVPSKRSKKYGESSYAYAQDSSSTSATPSIQQQPESEDDDTTSTPGICTLCHKGCSLSAPKCERPYDAGLTTVTAVR